MVSMRSIHFKRWTTQLKDAGHDVHWFDILDGGRIDELDWVTQHTQWRYKYPRLKGRFFLKNKFPKIHKLLENDLTKEFERLLQKIQPDVVHSFVLYKCCVPIFPVMQKYPGIKWIYSSWGSDLFYFKELPEYRKDIERVLPRIDYLFTDNKRDHYIAKELGFSGEFLGAFPGGGGFPIVKLEPYVMPVTKRKTILIKGYQGRSGRALPVLKALKQITFSLDEYKFVVFGADEEVVAFIEKDKFLRTRIHKIYAKKNMLPHQTVLELMGRSLLYIGNSNSDGMPNTLLEAIIMGAFPIQSNPGGVTEELITHHENGLLIGGHENEAEILTHIETALSEPDLIEKAFTFNQQLKQQLDYTKIQEQVVNCYRKIENELND